MKKIVIIGGGIAGLAAAYTYMKKFPGAHLSHVPFSNHLKSLVEKSLR